MWSVLDLELTTIDAMANMQVLDVVTDCLVVHKAIVVTLAIEKAGSADGVHCSQAVAWGVQRVCLNAAQAE